jgi:hypothetical protein
MSIFTRELLINCGMVPVSAISLDGSIVLGYWHPISCGPSECFAPAEDGYTLTEFPIIKRDAGAEFRRAKATIEKVTG